MQRTSHNEWIKQIAPYMNMGTTFKQCIQTLKERKVKISDVILNKAAQQGRVNFYDLGCGHAFISHDFFEQLEIRAKERKLPKRILNDITYTGIDRYVTDQDIPKDERIRVYSHMDLKRLEKADLLPLDVGVAVFVFPYFDRKLETLAGIYNLLRQTDEQYTAGELFITKYNDDQIKIIPPGTSEWRIENGVPFLPNLELDEIIEGDPNVVDVRDDCLHVTRGDARFKLPKYSHWKPETTVFRGVTLKGHRAGQVISFYIPRVA